MRLHIPLCLMLLFVPLVWLPGAYEWVSLPKQFVFALCLALCAAMACGSRARLRDLSVASPWIRVALIGGFLASIAASVGVTHPLGAVKAILELGGCLVLVWLVSTTVRREHLPDVLTCLSVSGGLVSLIGILQYHGLFALEKWFPVNAPPAATFGNRNLLAEFLAVSIPLSALLFTITTGWRRWLGAVASALMVLCLIYTRTRAAWLGLGVGAIVCAPAIWRHINWKKHKTTLISFCLAMCCAIVLCVGVKARADSKGSPAQAALQTNLQDPGIQERFAFWRGTWQMFNDHALLGVGPGQWTVAYPPYDAGRTIHDYGYGRSPHNDLLQVAAETGAVGLVFHVMLVILVIRVLARKKSPLIAGCAPFFLCSVVVYLVEGLFGFPGNQASTRMVFYMVCGLVLGFEIGDGQKPAPKRWAFVAPLCCLLLSLAGLWSARQQIGFDRHFMRASSWTEKNRSNEAVIEASAAREYGIWDPDLLFVEGRSLETTGDSVRAEASYREGLALAPSSWYLHDAFGGILLRRGEAEGALKHVRIAIAICPTAYHLYSNAGVIFVHLGDYEAALVAFRRAVQMNDRDLAAAENLKHIEALVEGMKKN